MSFLHRERRWSSGVKAEAALGCVTGSPGLSSSSGCLDSSPLKSLFQEASGQWGWRVRGFCPTGETPPAAEGFLVVFQMKDSLTTKP